MAGGKAIKKSSPEFEIPFGFNLVKRSEACQQFGEPVFELLNGDAEPNQKRSEVASGLTQQLWSYCSRLRDGHAFSHDEFAALVDAVAEHSDSDEEAREFVDQHIARFEYLFPRDLWELARDNGQIVMRDATQTEESEDADETIDEESEDAPSSEVWILRPSNDFFLWLGTMPGASGFNYRALYAERGPSAWFIPSEQLAEFSDEDQEELVERMTLSILKAEIEGLGVDLSHSTLKLDKDLFNRFFSLERTKHIRRIGMRPVVK